MSGYKLTGTLKVKNQEVQVKDTFRKREFVVTTDAQYPQHVLFQLTQDRCSQLDPFQVGEQITVSFDIRGREWTGREGDTRYFISLDAYRVEGAGAGAARPASTAYSGGAASSGSSSSAPAPSSFDSPMENDLPF